MLEACVGVYGYKVRGDTPDSEEHSIATVQPTHARFGVKLVPADCKGIAVVMLGVVLFRL